MDAQLMESIGQLKATSRAAHQRLDKVEGEIREDLKDLNAKLDTLNGHMNRSKGWSAAFLLMSSFAGGGMATLISMIFRSN